MNSATVCGLETYVKPRPVTLTATPRGLKNVLRPKCPTVPARASAKKVGWVKRVPKNYVRDATVNVPTALVNVVQKWQDSSAIMVLAARLSSAWIRSVPIMGRATCMPMPVPMVEALPVLVRARLVLLVFRVKDCPVKWVDPKTTVKNAPTPTTVCVWTERANATKGGPATRAIEKNASLSTVKNATSKVCVWPMALATARQSMTTWKIYWVDGPEMDVNFRIVVSVLVLPELDAPGTAIVTRVTLKKQEACPHACVLLDGRWITANANYVPCLQKWNVVEMFAGRATMQLTFKTPH